MKQAAVVAINWNTKDSAVTFFKEGAGLDPVSTCEMWIQISGQSLNEHGHGYDYYIVDNYKDKE